MSRNLRLFVAALMFKGTVTQAKLIIRQCSSGAKPGWQSKAMILKFIFRRSRGKHAYGPRHTHTGRPSAIAASYP